jgi:hypothetical protein
VGDILCLSCCLGGGAIEAISEVFPGEWLDGSVLCVVGVRHGWNENVFGGASSCVRGLSSVGK